jgi:hypothetical protein
MKFNHTFLLSKTESATDCGLSNQLTLLKNSFMTTSEPSYLQWLTQIFLDNIIIQCQRRVDR